VESGGEVPWAGGWGWVGEVSQGRGRGDAMNRDDVMSGQALKNEAVMSLPCYQAGLWLRISG
jgi:hypothetical protein